MRIAQGNVYSVAIHVGGTSYRPLCSFAFAYPPYRCRLTERSWYQDANGLLIIDAGHEKERGGIFHRTLDVECASESFTIPLEPVPPKQEAMNAPSDHAVMAVVVETGYPKATTTLMAVFDGSAGLYFTNGARMIREDQNPKSPSAARRLVVKAADFQSACTLANEFCSLGRT